MDTIEILKNVSAVLLLLTGVCFCYQTVYLAVSLFWKEPRHKPEKPTRYAVLIAARNEEAVLPYLLQSIRAQDYPAERIGVYVVADNCTDRTAEAAEAGRKRITSSLDRAVQRGKLAEADRDAALANLRFTTDLGEFGDRQIVIEAIAENEQLKTGVFARLDEVLPAGAILASNTSSIPIATLAAATERPGQVLGVHFFNPVPVLKLVELVPSLATSEQTVERASAFATEQLGKQTIRAKDSAGFVVNALLVPYLLSAIRMYESGVATAEDIDNGMILGCAHPMGPLTLSDMIGLDTLKSVADSMYEEFKEPLYAAPVLLQRMVDAAASGASDGLRLALNVGAMLFAFVSLIALVNLIVGGLGGLGLRLDLVLRAHNMLILLAVLTVFQDISGSAQGSGTHGQTGQLFQ